MNLIRQMQESIAKDVNSKIEKLVMNRFSEVTGESVDAAWIRKNKARLSAITNNKTKVFMVDGRAVIEISNDTEASLRDRVSHDEPFEYKMTVNYRIID